MTTRGNPPHGTQARYKAGCHCPPCTKGARRASNIYRLQLLEHGPRRVDATGSRRRILALATLGWNQQQIAAQAGVTKRQLQRIAAGQTPIVHVHTAAAIRAAYDALSMTLPPPATTRAEKVGRALTRRAAAANGGHPPLAWDDDTIDDPDATPHVGTHARTRDDLVDDVEFLLRHDPTLTAAQVAGRLGYRDNSGVTNSLKRADRRDLLDQLTRNAELAGHNIKKGTAA